MSEDDVCDAIGISKRELRSALETLTMCDLYRDSDFGDQFTSDKYSLFREIIRNRDVSRWIGWDDKENRPENLNNVYRLFSWISKDERIIDDQGEDEPEVLTQQSIRNGCSGIGQDHQRRKRPPNFRRDTTLIRSNSLK